MNLKKFGFSKIAGAMLSKIAFVIAVMIAVLFLQVGASFATGSGGEPKTPCDPEYMDALEARAWLEAQREITQNQNLIFRPDSVLELSCFDYFLNEAASNFGEKRQFSETSRWDGHPIGSSDVTTDNALNQVVMEPFKAYFTANFEGPGKKGAYLNNRTDKDYKPQGSVSGGTPYKCAEMQEIWKLARCMNFNPEEENKYDGFFDFQYYEKVDPRTESKEWDLMCKTADKRIKDARKSAFNEDQDLFDVGAENDDGSEKAEGNGKPYKEDDIVTHLEHVLPGPCDLCVPTGVCVQRPDINNNNPYQEKVCTNPGCPAPTDGSCSQSGAAAP